MRGQLSPEVPGELNFARMTKVKSPVPKCTLCKLTYGPVVEDCERGLNSTDFED
jgi:hypothetical protein